MILIHTSQADFTLGHIIKVSSAHNFILTLVQHFSSFYLKRRAVLGAVVGEEERDARQGT